MIRAGTRMIRAKPGWYGRGPGWSGQTKLLQPRNWNRHNFYIRTPILMILGSFWSYEKNPGPHIENHPRWTKMEDAKYAKVLSCIWVTYLALDFLLRYVGILYLYWIGVKYAYVGIWCEKNRNRRCWLEQIYHEPLWSPLNSAGSL